MGSPNSDTTAAMELPETKPQLPLFDVKESLITKWEMAGPEFLKHGDPTVEACFILGSEEKTVKLITKLHHEIVASRMVCDKTVKINEGFSKLDMDLIGTPDDFKKFLSYLYTEKLESDNLLAVYKFAQQCGKTKINPYSLALAISSCEVGLMLIDTFFVDSGDTACRSVLFGMVEQNGGSIVRSPFFTELKSGTLVEVVAHIRGRVEKPLLYQALLEWAKAECRRQKKSEAYPHTLEVIPQGITVFDRGSLEKTFNRDGEEEDDDVVIVDVVERSKHVHGSLRLAKTENGQLPSPVQILAKEIAAGNADFGSPSRKRKLEDVEGLSLALTELNGHRSPAKQPAVGVIPLGSSFTTGKEFLMARSLSSSSTPEVNRGSDQSRVETFEFPEIGTFRTSVFNASHENVDGAVFPQCSRQRVVGRVPPHVVWDYIRKLRASKEIIVLRLEPYSPADQRIFMEVFSHLEGRGRLGVVGKGATIKDIYLVPLGAHHEVNEVLLPWYGAGLPETRSACFLAIIIRRW